MKKTVWFAAVIILTCLVLFPSCSDGSGGGSLTTADLEGIWVATGDDEGTAKAMLFEFSGNSFTRIAYTELSGADPDGPDMFQDEGNKGTYSIADTSFSVSITHEWNDASADWVEKTEYHSFQFDLQADTLMMAIDGPVYFEKKSFTLPAALVDTWYEIDLSDGSSTGNTLVGVADGTYSYTDPGDSYTAEGTWSASPDLLRFITTYANDDGTESTFYIENLYEYTISGTDLELSWDGTTFSEYTNIP